ncbi:hypothetical protein [Zavarzinia compransoris]|nr:hypothetical protein [Zavarzinia compransoris]
MVNFVAMERAATTRMAALAAAFALAGGFAMPAPLAAATEDPALAGCRRLVKEKWEVSRPLDLEGCLDRLAGSPSPYDEHGYKLALWGDILLATDGIGLYQSDDGGVHWTVVRQPADLERAALDHAPADPPPQPAAVEPPAEPKPDAAATASQAARYRMWLTLARRCEPTLPDEGTPLRDLQFKASECERRLRLPPGDVSTTQN